MDKQNLKDAGLKATLPRVKILEVLEQTDNTHMSAEDICNVFAENNEDIALATVYRVLTQFEAAGMVCRHRFEDGRAVFELNRGDHHDHLVCMKCGEVVEFVDSIIEERQEQIAKDAGFEMTDHCLYIYGICGSCK
ncbi:MAG: ferric iron uptake transcriptional regulator [Gammaproteobacteria bacterium]|nr:ferric iron uptake transcriptional regulator [Gammaproteobacteria bacterium]